ncbi:hypothetical protein BC829DRAFT_408250 [Chytridium lagenaria]|nr:hypothetical protein BC829DRAFT_408250 [Chytridium lagenaria]
MPSSMSRLALFAVLALVLLVESVAAQARCECYCSGSYVGVVLGSCSDFNCYQTFSFNAFCNPISRVNSRLIGGTYYYTRPYNLVAVIAGAVVGGIILISLIVILCVYWRRRGSRDDVMMYDSGPMYNTAYVTTAQTAPVVYNQPSTVYAGAPVGGAPTYAAPGVPAYGAQNYAAPAYPPPSSTVVYK